MYTVYGKPNCVFCDAAKQVLDLKGLPWTYLDIVADPQHRTVMFSKVTAASGIPPRSVPQIFLNDELIGGFDSLKTHLNL